jgi:hypothetical protein
VLEIDGVLKRWVFGVRLEWRFLEQKVKMDLAKLLKVV